MTRIVRVFADLTRVIYQAEPAEVCACLPSTGLPAPPTPKGAPFDYAQEAPFDYAQEAPFDYAQEAPFDYAQEAPFDSAQETPRPPPLGKWAIKLDGLKNPRKPASSASSAFYHDLQVRPTSKSYHDLFAEARVTYQAEPPAPPTPEGAPARLLLENGLSS